MDIDKFFTEVLAMSDKVKIDKTNSDCPDSFIVIVTSNPGGEEGELTVGTTVAGQLEMMSQGISLVMEKSREMAAMVMAAVLVHCADNQGDLVFLIDSLKEKCQCQACRVKRALEDAKKAGNRNNLNVN